MIDSVTGVILAGGKSTRMGTNKALLPFHGRPLIERVLETLNGVFARVVLSVHQEGAFPNLDLPKVVDRYREVGPMGGIASVLETGELRIFCAACDMPYLNQSLIEYMCQLADSQAVIPVWQGNVEVLHAIYSRSLLPSFHAALRGNLYRITDALPRERIRYVSQTEIIPFDPNGLSFKNLNTPADYQQIID